MHKLFLVIKREFLAKVKSKSYLVLIFLSPLLMLLMFGAIFYFSQKEEQATDEPVTLLVLASENTQEEISNKHPKLEIHHKNHTLQVGKALVDSNIYNGVVYEDLETQKFEIYGNVNLPFSSLKKIVSNHRAAYLLTQQNVSDELIRKLQNTQSIVVTKIDDKEATINKWVKKGIAIGCGYLIMMFVIIYGNSVMRSIIEEKNSRVIEIMICSIKPFQLMLGKIVGNALAGILQFFIWGTLLLIGLWALQIGFANGIETDQVSQIFDSFWNLNFVEISISFLLLFSLGYLVYSGFYTAVGAAVNSETDTQQFMHPILLPLMFAFYMGLMSVINGNPESDTAVLFSLIPFTSPIVMMMRIPYGVPVWQIILSLALLLVTFVITVYTASKIYRIGILTYGNKPTIKQLVKWVFQKQ